MASKHVTEPHHQNNDAIREALNHLKKDFEMIQSGECVPESKDIDASIENVELIAEEVGVALD